VAIFTKQVLLLTDDFDLEKHEQLTEPDKQ